MRRKSVTKETVRTNFENRQWLAKNVVVLASLKRGWVPTISQRDPQKEITTFLSARVSILELYPNHICSKEIGYSNNLNVAIHKLRFLYQYMPFWQRIPPLAKCHSFHTPISLAIQQSPAVQCFRSLILSKSTKKHLWSLCSLNILHIPSNSTLLAPLLSSH